MCMMCPSSTPLSFMDWSASLVHTLRANTFRSKIFLQLSVGPSVEHKWCTLLEARTVMTQSTGYTSLTEERILYAVLSRFHLTPIRTACYLKTNLNDYSSSFQCTLFQNLSHNSVCITSFNPRHIPNSSLHFTVVSVLWDLYKLLVLRLTICNTLNCLPEGGGWWLDVTCGDGLEYLHRSPPSLEGDRKGNQ
jgi:hypothetical protein